jgi:hypothetical protein
MSYVFACLRAIRILSPVEALFWLRPLYVVELIIASIGVTFGTYILIRDKAQKADYPPMLEVFFRFALCFFVGFVLECSIFQYSHYGTIGVQEVISTRSANTPWTTLRFGELSVGNDATFEEHFYFSLANAVDGAKNDEDRIAFIEHILKSPENARDLEYTRQLSEYEKRIEESGLDAVYPKFVSFDNDLAVITFTNLDTNISSIHIEPFFLPEKNQITGKKTQSIDVMLVYSDEDNTNRKTSMFSIVEGQEYTEYIPFYPVGKVSELNICFASRGAAFTGITLNEMIPLTPVLLRILIVSGVLSALWLLRRHDLFATSFDPNNRKQNLCFALMLLLLFGYCAFMTFTAVEFDYEPGSAGQYNHYLIDALLEGRVDFNLPTSEEYAALERPYDRGQFELYGIDYLSDKVHWDTVFYNGKWYSYFGIGGTAGSGTPQGSYFKRRSRGSGGYHHEYPGR